MSVAHRLLPHYTYDDYCHWEDQWELIEGVPYALSPAPVPRHQLVASNLKAEFVFALRKSKCACKVYDPIDYKIGESTVLQPDALIVCGAITKKFLDFPPAVVVEVLLPSTEPKDRYIKFTIYQQQGVPYYVIVDADKEQVEIYYLTEEKRYELQPADLQQPFTFHFPDCTVSVTLNAIWS